VRLRLSSLLLVALVSGAVVGLADGARTAKRNRFQSTKLAFAAYNAGPTAVERRGARPNDETVAYVADVTDEGRRLVGCT